VLPGGACEIEGARMVSRFLRIGCGRSGRCRNQARRGSCEPGLLPLPGKRYPIEALEEALGEGIISGHPDMPEFRFESNEVGAMIAYLKSIEER
jgi:hypothetical protein